MAKKIITPVTKFLYVIETPQGLVGSPTDTRTTNPHRAATWVDEGEANAVAKTLGGFVKTQHVVDQIATARAKKDAAAHPPTMSLAQPAGAVSLVKSEPVAPEGMVTLEQKPAAESKKAKTPAGPSRDLVVALLKDSGLVLHEKSSSHYGDPKGSRLVLPKSATVTRIFLYKTEDSSLIGYKTPEQRKAEGLGAVTHVCDIVALSQVETLIAAVRKANGLVPTPPAPAPTKRTRTKKSPDVSSEAGPSGQVDTGKDTKAFAQTAASARGVNVIIRRKAA